MTKPVTKEVVLMSLKVTLGVKMGVRGIGTETMVGTETMIKTRKGDAAEIVRWYAAYYAGDKYRLFIDGKLARLDMNGHI